MTDAAVSVTSASVPTEPIESSARVATSAPKLSRILIVDDDEAVRDVTSDALGELGYQIETAEDGQAALNAMDSFQPDLVITDLRMPRMSGFELLSILRVDFPQLPVIATSGDFRGDALPPGVTADAFLAKGGGIFRLRTTVAELLAISPMRIQKVPKLSKDHPDIEENADMMAVYRRLGHNGHRDAVAAVGSQLPAGSKDGCE